LVSHGLRRFRFLGKGVAVITGAPHLVFAGIIAITVIAVSITWFLVNWGYRERLKLADERKAFANDVRDDIARQFKDFKEAAAAGAGIDALSARIEKLEAAVRSALTGTLAAMEGADIGGVVE
jgi:hypothetical protein